MVSDNCLTKVLLVEDDKFIQAVHSSMLLLLNCRVTLATSGLQAIEKAKNNYDIIFMDMELPDMSGDKVIRIIRLSEWNKESMPIIVLSANSDQETKKKCLAAGANDFFTKPTSLETLRRILQQYGFNTNLGQQPPLSPITKDPNDPSTGTKH